MPARRPTQIHHVLLSILELGAAERNGAGSRLSRLSTTCMYNIVVQDFPYSTHRHANFIRPVLRECAHISRSVHAFCVHVQSNARFLLDSC